MQSYTVLVTPKHPAWDQRDGWKEEVYTSSKEKAVKMVRRRVAAEMLCEGGFSCKVVEG